MQEKLDEDAQRTNLVKQQLDELKRKPAQWLAEIKWIDSEISSKSISLLSCVLYSAGNLCWCVSNLTTDILDSDHFPQSNDSADSAVKKSRRRQIRDGPISSEPSIDDMLLSLRTRINPLRVMGVDLFSAAIRAHDVLWPGEEPLKGIIELIARLRDTESKLRAWRHSSARAGSDEALAWVLSWYEGMNLNLLERTRDGSLWLSDPERIQRRQARAYEIRSEERRVGKECRL